MRKSLKITKFIKATIKIIFILMFIMLILYNVMNINNKEEYVEVIGYKIFVVQEYQKQQGLEKDTIIIAKSRNNDLKVNDLVVIRISGTTYFHRIVDIIGNEKYVTKGDGNYREDIENFNYEQIQGKVVAKISWFGKILNIAKTKIFSVIILIILIITFKYNKHIHIKMNKRRFKQKAQNNNQV